MQRIGLSMGAVFLALEFSAGLAAGQVLQQPIPGHGGHGHMVKDSAGDVILSSVATGSVTKFRNGDWSVLWDAGVAISYGQLAIDSSDNVYVSGTQPGVDNQGRAVSLLTLSKISPSGALLWTSQVNIGLISEHSSAGPIALGSNGSAYVIGTCGNSSQSTAPATLVRFATSNGAVQTTLGLGGVLDFGGDMPTHALRVDSNNNVLWASPAGLKRFTPALGNNGSWSGQTPVRAFAFSGSSIYLTGTQATGSSYQMYVAKLAASGLTTTWTYAFPGQTRSIAYPGSPTVNQPGNYTTYGGNGLTVDSSGNVYVAGEGVRPNRSFTGGLFAKLNPNGQIQWVKQFGYDGFDSACFDTAISGNGRLVVSCTDMQLMNGSSTALAAIYDQSGNQLSAFSNDGPGGVSDAFDHLLIGASGTLFLLDEAGYWQDSNANSEYYIPSIFVYTQTGL